MDKLKLNRLYETCQEASLTSDDFFYLLKQAKTEEEKKFYVMVKNYFLQEGLKKIVKENKF